MKEKCSIIFAHLFYIHASFSSSFHVLFSLRLIKKNNNKLLFSVSLFFSFNYLVTQLLRSQSYTQNVELE